MKIKDEKKLIEKIKEKYNEYRKGGKWVCTKCGIEILYNNIPPDHKGRLVLKVRCPICRKFIENFVSQYKDDFTCEEFDLLFHKYEMWIYNQCFNFHIEDIDDMYCDMLHRFFVSVMTYNGTSKFSTYLTHNIKRRFEDFERKNSRLCKSNGVQCCLCGRYVGAITRIHLMNNKVKPKAGFDGHDLLHQFIINDIGKEKFDSWSDHKEYGFKWEGNKYSTKQRRIIKGMIVNYYRRMFPHCEISSPNISISDRDPKTDMEYGSLIADKRRYFDLGDGSYNLGYFIPEYMDFESINICRDFSERFSDLLHDHCNNYRKKHLLKHTQDKEGLKHFLENVLPFLMNGYNIHDIASKFGYEEGEVSFWLKRIKTSKDIKHKMNIL